LLLERQRCKETYVCCAKPGLIFGFRQKNSRKKNSKLKQKTQNSSKKLKNSAFNYSLDAEKRPKTSLAGLIFWLSTKKLKGKNSKLKEKT